RVAALLVAGTNISLTYSDVGNTLTLDVPTFAPTNATYITQTSNSTLSNEQALGSLATGILKNTTTTGVLSIAPGSLLRSRSHTHSDVSDWNEAVDDRVAALLVAGTHITLTYNDVSNTLTVDAADAPVDGSGTASRVAQWSDSNTLAAATLIKSGA